MDLKINQIESFSNEKRVILNSLKASDGLSQFGQLYIIKIKPGVTLGNHYHQNKNEHWIAVSGKLKAVFIDAKTNEHKELELDSSSPARIEIGPGVAHAISNISDSEAILLEYSTSEFNPAKEDKVNFSVA